MRFMHHLLRPLLYGGLHGARHSGHKSKRGKARPVWKLSTDERILYFALLKEKQRIAEAMAHEIALGKSRPANVVSMRPPPQAPTLIVPPTVHPTPPQVPQVPSEQLTLAYDALVSQGVGQRVAREAVRRADIQASDDDGEVVRKAFRAMRP